MIRPLPRASDPNAASRPLAFQAPDGSLDWKTLAVARGEEILALQARIRTLEARANPPPSSRAIELEAELAAEQAREDDIAEATLAIREAIKDQGAFARVPPSEGVTTQMPRDVCHDEPREHPLPWSVRPCAKHHGRTDPPCYRVRDADGEIVPGAVVLVRMLVQEERARVAEDKLLSMAEYLNDGDVQGARDLVPCVSPTEDR